MPITLPRPTFRLDLKFVETSRDGSRRVFWMHYPGVFSGRCVDTALAEASEAACEEVRRISRRPQYDLLSNIGVEYHLLNLKFVRVDVGDEDDDAVKNGGNPQGGTCPG